MFRPATFTFMAIRTKFAQQLKSHCHFKDSSEKKNCHAVANFLFSIPIFVVRAFTHCLYVYVCVCLAVYKHMALHYRAQNHLE